MYFILGVGVKTYMAGPTHCTKLKVYRPKTCGVVPKPLDRLKYGSRPHTCSGGEKEKMGAMDLAICWDYRPADPRDEPKRPAHIDGSNGSAAPAVFTLVKTPRTPNLDPNTGRSGGVFSNTLGENDFFDKDIMRRNAPFACKSIPADRQCSCRATQKYFKNENNQNCNAAAYIEECRPRSMSRPRELDNKHRRCKSSPNTSQIVQVGNSDNSSIHHHQHHQHRTNDEKKENKIIHASRQREKCHHKLMSKPKLRLCEQINATTQGDMYAVGGGEGTKHKLLLPTNDEFKQPFKAGIPNSNSSGTCTSFDSGCSSMSSATCSSKSIRVPKPRHPYTKKDYVIDTLAPPFACWRGGAGQGGYPEHWRLASVYQHAYKPIEQRKRPLLATVYQ